MKNYCVVTGEEIPQERVEALIMLEIPRERWTVVRASRERRNKAVWSGEAGTSELIVCKDVGENIVESLFAAKTV
jgi:hypothetical protein